VEAAVSICRLLSFYLYRKVSRGAQQYGMYLRGICVLFGLSTMSHDKA